MSESFKIIGGYVLICLIWGSTWLATRIGLNSLSPLFAAGARFLLASVFIFILMKLKNMSLPWDTLSVKFYIILGLFSYVIPFGLDFWAQQFIPSGLASVLFGTFPFFVIIFSRLFMKEEPVGLDKTVGVILGFAGTYLIFASNLQIKLSEYKWGMAAVLFSAIVQGAIAVFVKLKGRKLNPLSMNFIPMLLAGIILLLLSFIFEASRTQLFNGESVIAIIYLAFFGSVVTFTVYYWLMKKINVVILSLTAFITPIIALILGYIILNEHLSKETIIGIILVLFGILFADIKRLEKIFDNKILRA